MSEQIKKNLDCLFAAYMEEQTLTGKLASAKAELRRQEKALVDVICQEQEGLPEEVFVKSPWGLMLITFDVEEGKLLEMRLIESLI